MRIESGSQNATSIPGSYAYVVQRYNTMPVDAVNAVRARGPEAAERKETDPAHEEPLRLYSPNRFDADRRLLTENVGRLLNLLA